MPDVVNDMMNVKQLDGYHKIIQLKYLFLSTYLFKSQR